ncbi:hypothetical protein B0P06_001717 [Clostridium saccharoperbutylacetonicum]|uniref:Uncharacterized protein n=1 Tax=Clostridium saccharoperbutylacetonicum N1-4(HMT) TaxID=931276 RepID=M1M8D7_9CLOT|nr:hypothetical protein [Clostridium saccharoperbutylacetonicum]AGF54219.1 hypothetical protein Cspa_c04010 [Clostridium saccharoperbutylacetonicum N1-4(HMT)]NRT59267.1 hypothetical protein [Clostridium saccharoperbutylacetonicum]NSB28457.1 hypothetical protein [Clostridium saccharoperbutylacetonicum]NSB41946.1 hypothetical protein [Clostridium saccharoperbutylacetonicum]
MKFKSSIINIILVIVGILLSTKFSAFYEWGVGTLFYFSKKGDMFLRIISVVGIILINLIITQGIIFFIYKKFKKKALVIVSLYNLLLTILIATMNIALFFG